MENELIAVDKPLPRISSVHLLDARKVRIDWAGGVSRVVDLMPALASHRAFIALRSDDNLFRTVQVNEDSNALKWADGSELSAEWAERLPSCVMANSEFRTAMDDLHSSIAVHAGA